MVWFRDVDRLTPFIKAFRPMLARQLDKNVESAYDQMIANWEQGQDAHGQPWEPLAPSTVEQKGHSTPLIETRQMIDSADYEVNRDDLTAVITIDDEEEKVLAHEYGVPEQGIPARPVLEPTRELIADDSGHLLKRAFDKSWAKASVTGTALHVGFGGGGAPGGHGGGGGLL